MPLAFPIKPIDKALLIGDRYAKDDERKTGDFPLVINM